MSLERIVRPAQTPNVSPVRLPAVNRTAQNWQPVQHKWGVGGTIKTLSGSYSLNMSLYAVKRPKEDKNGGGSSFLGITFP